MSKSSYCKVCGVELTPENRYSNGKNKRRYCKTHWNAYKEKNRTKNYRLKVRVGTNRSHLIEFSSYALKNSFQVLRKLQIRWGRCHSSRSSNYNQRIEDLVEHRQEDGSIIRFYEKSKCAECDSDLRYDEHGYKVCTYCGLIREEIILPAAFIETKHSHDTKSSAYLGWDSEADFETPPDERYATFDRYYAQVYAKRRK